MKLPPMKMHQAYTCGFITSENGKNSNDNKYNRTHDRVRWQTTTTKNISTKKKHTAFL